MALTDKVARSAKPQQKAYKLSDEKGMYLLVHPRGARYWRLKYRMGGHEHVLALGVYPETGLAKARELRDAARQNIKNGIDPAQQRRADRTAAGDTFKAIAEEWLEKQLKSFEAATLEKCKWQFEKLIYPYLGSRPVRSITPPDVLVALRTIESRGKIESAHRAKQRIGQVMRYAIATGRAERDPTPDLRGALTPQSTAHRAAIVEPKRVGELLRAIDGHTGQPSVHFALRLAPLVFVRPGELRWAEWSEFHLDAKCPEWRIPKERMKMRDAHIVPLSRQAVDLLEALRPLSPGRLLFPGLSSGGKPISEATLGAALRRLGYASSEMTPHGFRSIASTLLNEQAYPGDLIELQLAHRPRDKTRAAYNRASRLDERRRMMQSWADYLDGLKAGAAVVSIGAARKRVVS